MSILPNVFSDPKLRARQDQLNGQWNSAWALYQHCDNIPQEIFPEFVTDLASWRSFYDSESDWSLDSKKATDEWQTKLASWIARFKSYGCSGTMGSVDGVDVAAEAGDLGITTVDANPPDEPTYFQQLKDNLTGLENSIVGPFEKVGIVVSIIILVIVIGLIIVLVKGKFEGFGVKAGNG